MGGHTEERRAERNPNKAKKSAAARPISTGKIPVAGSSNAEPVASKIREAPPFLPGWSEAGGEGGLGSRASTSEAWMGARLSFFKRGFDEGLRQYSIIRGQSQY
jgi:hypothetical protein